MRTLTLQCVFLAVGLLATGAGAEDMASEYVALAANRLGSSQEGIIIRDIGTDDWEVIAVAKVVFDSGNGRAKNEIVREATLMAGANARAALAEFLTGAAVREKTLTESDTDVRVDSERSQAQVRNFLSTQTTKDVNAFLRGVRQVASWESEDGRELLVAVALKPADAKRGMELTKEILVPTEKVRFRVVNEDVQEHKPRIVQAWGVAVGTSPTARRAAVRDALQVAVEGTAGLMLTGRTAVTNLKEVESTVTTVTMGFVKSFRIVEEEAVSGQYKVLIEAEVEPRFDGPVAGLLLLLGGPTVLVRGTDSPMHAYSTKLARDFAAERELPTVATTEMATSLQEALLLARRTGTSVLIWAYDDKFIQAYVVASGSAFGHRAVVRPKANGENARQLALLYESLVEYWHDELFNGRHLRCVINGVDSVMLADAVRQLIKVSSGCTAVNQVELAPKQGRMVVDVRYLGTPAEFASAVQTAVISSRQEAVRHLVLVGYEGDVLSWETGD